MLINKKRSVTLLHGIANDTLFGLLKKRKAKHVFVLEGRPKLEGAKVLCRKLLKKKITPTLISDNMAGFLFYKDFVKEVWVAYQSVDSQGALCSIGALILGVLGKKHNVPVYLTPAAGKTKTMGSPNDILKFEGKQIAAKGVKTYVPLVENLPKKYITEIYR